MLADRTTKVLLLAIALGLWMQIVSAWIAPAHAQDRTLSAYVQADVAAMRADLHETRVLIEAISQGRCGNKHLCP